MSNHSQPKIGYLLKTYPKLSETFILNEILELERQGLNLHIFSLRQPKDEKFHPGVANVQAQVTYIPSLLPTFTFNDTFRLLQAHLELFRQNPQRYLKTFRFYCSRSEEKRLNEFLQAGYLAREMQKLGIAHLHAHFANVPTAVAELAQGFCGIPYSFTAHAKDIYLSEPDALNRRIAGAKVVLTCTEYNQRFLQGISTNDTPIHLAYHGLDLTRFSPSPISEQLLNDLPLILSVGRFCEKKGFPYLLQACQLLKQKGHSFRCSIVGYGPLQADIERMIAELQLNDVVSIVGKLTQDELIDLYRKADIFVLPCLITEQGDRDGIPNVLLEAMAMKVPVISTSISGIVELINDRETGILVPQKDPQALATELEELISQPQLRQQLRQAGREKVFQQFSLDKNTSLVKDLLVSTLQEPVQDKQSNMEVTV